MRYRVLSIGKDRSGLFEPIVAEYAERLQRYAKTDFVVAGEAQGDDATARRAEAALLRKKLGGAETRFVALHAEGELLTSEALASRLAAEARRDGRGLTFVLGERAASIPTFSPPPPGSSPSRASPSPTSWPGRFSPSSSIALRPS